MTSSSHLTTAERAVGSANGLKEAPPLAERDPLARALAVDEALDRRNNLLNRRLQMVEELWEAVILQECGQPLVDLLQRLRSMCSPEGQALEYPIPEVLQIVEHLSLDAAIQTARAFALFFQLINIVEQHYERAEDSDMRMVDSQQRTVRENEKFERLFPYLRLQGVPPGLLRRLLERLHIRLVFTAHPTEIVRHTIREKQRAFSHLLSQLDWAEQSHPLQAQMLREQLAEEVLLWWRTDELHQSKPTVLNEVDYTLHYFEEVLFQAIPLLHEYLSRSLKKSFPSVEPPPAGFCNFTP